MKLLGAMLAVLACLGCSDRDRAALDHDLTGTWETVNSEISKATARAVCVTKPNYECVINLALEAAEGAYSAHPSDSYFLADLLLDIATAQSDMGDTSGARLTLRSAASEADRGRGILNVRSLARIAIEQTNIGDLQGADQTFSTLHVAAATNMARGHLVAALAQTGQIAQASEVALSIDKEDRNRLLALAEVAQAQAEAGDVATAMKTALSIDEHYLRHTALAGIAFMQAKGGDYEGARKTVMGIGDKTVTQDPPLTWQKLLSDEAAGGLSPKRQAALDEARRRGLVPDDAMGMGFYQIASWQLARGGHEAAEQTINSAPSFLLSGPAGLFLRLVSTIVQAMKGDFAAALATADRFDVGDQNERALRVAVHNEIAALQAGAGDRRAAERTLQFALIAARAEGDARGRALLVSTVAVAQAKAGDPLAARRLIDEIATNLEAAEGDIHLPSSLSDIAGLQASAGFAAMGIATALGIHLPFNEIREAQLRVEALVSISRHLAGKQPHPSWYPRKHNFFWV